MNKSLFEVLKFKLNFTNRSSPIFPPNPKSADQLIHQLPRTSCHMLTLHSSPHSLKYTIPPSTNPLSNKFWKIHFPRFGQEVQNARSHVLPPTSPDADWTEKLPTEPRNVWQISLTVPTVVLAEKRTFSKHMPKCWLTGWHCKVARENSVGEGREWWLRRAGIGRVVVNIGWKCLWRENDRKFERWERCSLVENYGKQGCQLARTLWIVVKSLKTSDMVQCFFSENLYFS